MFIATTCVTDCTICIKGCVPFYIMKCWSMGLCHNKILQQSSLYKCVQLHERTQFGRNIIGEVCLNNVTWFCACLCRNEDAMDYVCCNVLCMTCSLFRPFSANISKRTKVIILCFQEISPSIVHILKSHLVLICQQHLFSTPIVLFSCTPFGIKFYIYIYPWVLLLYCWRHASFQRGKQDQNCW